MKKSILLIALSVGLFSCEKEDEIGNRIKYYNNQTKSEDVKGFWKLAVLKSDIPSPLKGIVFNSRDHILFDGVFMKRIVEDEKGGYVNFVSENAYWYSTLNRITYMQFYESGNQRLQQVQEYSMLYKLNETKDTLFLRSDSLAYFYKVPSVEYTEGSIRMMSR